MTPLVARSVKLVEFAIFAYIASILFKASIHQKCMVLLLVGDGC